MSFEVLDSDFSFEGLAALYEGLESGPKTAISAVKSLFLSLIGDQTQPEIPVRPQQLRARTITSLPEGLLAHILTYSPDHHGGVSRRFALSARLATQHLRNQVCRYFPYFRRANEAHGEPVPLRHLVDWAKTQLSSATYEGIRKQFPSIRFLQFFERLNTALLAEDRATVILGRSLQNEHGEAIIPIDDDAPIYEQAQAIRFWINNPRNRPFVQRVNQLNLERHSLTHAPKELHRFKRLSSVDLSRNLIRKLDSLFQRLPRTFHFLNLDANQIDKEGLDLTVANMPEVFCISTRSNPCSLQECRVKRLTPQKILSIGVISMFSALLPVLAKRIEIMQTKQNTPYTVALKASLSSLTPLLGRITLFFCLYSLQVKVSQNKKVNLEEALINPFVLLTKGVLVFI